MKKVGSAISTITLTIVMIVMINSILHAQVESQQHLRVELISENKSIQPGEPFWVGMRFILDQHWHIYWRNPGDAGLPPRIIWDLPKGFGVGEIQWPSPERFESAGLVSFGYKGEVLLPVKIIPPKNLQTDNSIELKASVDWLICREECIPGSADLSLALPVNDAVPEIDDRHSELFNQARENLPFSTSEWKISAVKNDDNLLLYIDKPEWFKDKLEDIGLFPYNKGLVDYSASQVMTETQSGYLLEIKRSDQGLDLPDTLRGILTSQSGWRGPGSEKAIEFSTTFGTHANPTIALAGLEKIGLWKALIFAFLGGLILNLMPCVLPVLSLKILGFVKQAGERRADIFRHGLIFTLGVLISFWLLVGILFLLRAGGEELGWGFQLQSPGFLVILSAFMFLFGLNLLGVFEIGTSLTGLAGKGTGRRGWFGSFLNGVTATIVATPCTAPFMGSALGFSLTQGMAASFLIFSFLGLGMAAPYLLLSAFPALLRFLPKPGRWMESLKQFMGFLLLGTVIWLAWVLGIQAGINSVGILMIALLLLGIGAWILGRWGIFGAAFRSRAIAYVLTALFMIGGISLGLLGIDARAASMSSRGYGSGESIGWREFSPELVERVRAEGSPVFIDFTAAWCLSCQVNEKVAFSSDEVQKKFRDLNITLLKADWTSRDPEITRALASFGRNSVPLYVLYDGRGGEPIILPEIITPGIVLEALKNIDG